MVGNVSAQSGKIVNVAEIPWVSIMVDVFLGSLGYVLVSEYLVQYLPGVVAFLLVWALFGFGYFLFALRKGATLHAAFYYAYGGKAPLISPWLISPAFLGPTWWKLPVIAAIAWFVYHYV
ncbi:hypothetical protein [Palaeococcus ferrophilus]|uniref:hypothetical protein n=1 Tax=Palaeococcus ferrophilus TaxID=83868 RepID=UPI0012FAC106|nr:hypothetical protein [Palaeococcus ferrophilus]